MRALIIKDINEYLKAGIIADFTRKYAEQLYSEGKIADPAIKAETQKRRWDRGEFDEVEEKKIEKAPEVPKNVKTTPKATKPLNVAKKQSTGFFTKKHK